MIALVALVVISSPGATTPVRALPFAAAAVVRHSPINVPPAASVGVRHPRPGNARVTGAPSRTTAASAPAAAGCPDPKACADYKTLGRWIADSAGDVTIHYRVNPSGHNVGTLTDAQVVGAAVAAAGTWAAADSHLHLAFDGTTSDLPVGGNNVIGFLPLPPDRGAEVMYGNGTYQADASGILIDRFNLQVNGLVGWSWYPCNPRGGDPCTPIPAAPITDQSGRGRYGDLQDVLTHEWGHVLGLDHPQGTNDNLLTMFSASNQCSTQPVICRERDTLALGDVLGLRSLYPVADPMPRIYEP